MNKKDYNITCPFCHAPIKDCKEFKQCSNCKIKIKVQYPSKKCSCGNRTIVTYIKNNDKMTYCGKCGHVIKQGNLVNTNILKERLNFKIKIPEDYLIDLQIDVYKFGKGEKIN